MELTGSSSFLVVRVQGSPAFEVSRNYDIDNIQTKCYALSVRYLQMIATTWPNEPAH